MVSNYICLGLRKKWRGKEKKCITKKYKISRAKSQYHIASTFRIMYSIIFYFHYPVAWFQFHKKVSNLSPVTNLTPQIVQKNTGKIPLKSFVNLSFTSVASSILIGRVGIALLIQQILRTWISTCTIDEKIVIKMSSNSSH